MKFEEISRYYTEALHKAERITSWYPKRKRNFRILSQSIRFGTVSLAGIGGVLPLVELAISDLWGPIRLVNYGYVAFSCAASLFLLDKYFGYSTGWMRFMLTELELKKTINQYKGKWLRYEVSFLGKELGNQEINEILDFIQKFNEAIDYLVVAETKEWINEFKSSYQSLENLTQQKSSGESSSNMKLTELSSKVKP